MKTAIFHPFNFNTKSLKRLPPRAKIAHQAFGFNPTNTLAVKRRVRPVKPLGKHAMRKKKTDTLPRLDMRYLPRHLVKKYMAIEARKRAENSKSLRFCLTPQIAP